MVVLQSRSFTCTQVIGCQPLNSKVMYESVKVGRIVFEESADTLSDGTAGGVEEDAVQLPVMHMPDC